MSILAGRDRIPLDNGMELRLLSALEALQARREGRELAQDGRELALCSNANPSWSRNPPRPGWPRRWRRAG